MEIESPLRVAIQKSTYHATSSESFDSITKTRKTSASSKGFHLGKWIDNFTSKEIKNHELICWLMGSDQPSKRENFHSLEGESIRINPRIYQHLSCDT